MRHGWRWPEHRIGCSPLEDDAKCAKPHSGMALSSRQSACRPAPRWRSASASTCPPIQQLALIPPLPRLLRATIGCELLLLRRNVLGVRRWTTGTRAPGTTRSVGDRGAGCEVPVLFVLRAPVRYYYQAAGVLHFTAGGRMHHYRTGANTGGAGRAQHRAGWDQRNPRVLCLQPRPAAGLPATIRGRSLSAAPAWQ